MAKSNWEELLPASTTTSATRNTLLGQLAASTVAGAGEEGIRSSGAVSQSSDITEHLTSLTNQIVSLTSNQQSQISALQQNTDAVTQNTTSKGSSGASIASTVEGVASSFLGGGLSSISPILGGILSLFGHNDEKTITPPSAFMLPAPVQAQAGLTSNAPGQVVPVSYGETGNPRAQGTSAGPQVTIQVNAMDSRSFLDHSNEIAMAVKQAILSSSSLNDVISDL
jgi:hypothetical protein